MTTQPDGTSGPTPPRPPYLVQRNPDGAILVGSLVYGETREAARARADDAVEMHLAGTWEADAAEAVLDFLDAADQRAQHADQVAAFPEQQTRTCPRPTDPPVDLRLSVDVARVERAVVLITIPPALLGDDPTGAVQDATRALHDAALAAARVLVVEPAERDRP